MSSGVISLSHFQWPLCGGRGIGVSTGTSVADRIAACKIWSHGVR
jgi:hypothetical protein